MARRRHEQAWFKSEGFVEHGRMTGGDQEALYDRPISYLSLNGRNTPHLLLVKQALALVQFEN